MHLFSTGNLPANNRPDGSGYGRCRRQCQRPPCAKGAPRSGGGLLQPLRQKSEIFDTSPYTGEARASRSILFDKQKFERGTPFGVPLLLSYKGFLPVMVEDMINSPTDKVLPHFSSYSRETGFACTETSTNPTDRMSFSNSSTEEAPLTQHECILGSFFSSSGICFMITMSQMDSRPPGFKTR